MDRIMRTSEVVKLTGLSKRVFPKYKTYTNIYG